MKKIIFVCLFFITLVTGGCQKVTVGYLLTENAQYPGSFEVYRTPDEVIDAVRIKYKAPWVGKPISGVLGTAPICCSIHNVKTTDGNAEIMKREITVYGNGTCYMPFNMQTPAGTYTVSVKIYNDERSAVKDDILTIVVKEKRI